jgi:DNA-binding LytR/AlgR family response regulator
VNKRIDDLIWNIKTEFRLLLSISIGIFLFVLFFQPFPLINSDINNALIFVAGLGGIMFLTLLLVRTLIPWSLRKNRAENDNMDFLPPYLRGFLIFIISTVAFDFYLRFVGSVAITFFLTFKVAVITLSAAVILGIYDTLNNLRQQNASLILEKKLAQKQIEKFEEDYLFKSVEFISENINENFTLPVADVAFIRSADNYVEIVYKEDAGFKKKLIRNTLKNIEQQLKQYSNFLRCHRICIVNIHFIEKLFRDNENHWLSIKGFSGQLPVSRQYLVKLREAI